MSKSGSCLARTRREREGRLKGVAYVIDLRNHGDSEWNDVSNFDCNVDDLLHFMDRMEISKAILIGHSVGGITAIKTALGWPERVEKIIVEDADIRRPPRQMIDLTLIYLSLAQKAITQVPVGASEEEAKKFIIDYVVKLTSGLKSQGVTISRKPGSNHARITTYSKDHRIRCMAVDLYSVSSAEIICFVATRVKQRTVTNRLFEEYLRARYPVSFIPFASNH
ncbi:AB hydrolase-1 domain-containing protein [Trichonephila clavipes]|nr:AB hydrolase-1 domain-containing protein [Trichonephila clavipes]